MLVHKVVSAHGRLIPKPEIKSTTEEEILEEPSTIQDQIENLRTKISLKERYTKVLEEELEETHQGAETILQDLYYETRDLRIQLLDALNAEKDAVQHALRTHRLFQLAMTDRPPTIAIPWLEDKLFDLIKFFNCLLNNLHDKRLKLEDSERVVAMLEKWPVPGSLPWEVETLKKFHFIETQIENVKIKRETACILYAKYKEIKYILREEKGKYLPTLQQFETQLRVQRKELQSLNKMLADANMFRDETYKNLITTEKESTENRKVRRQQMSQMKKSVEKALAENHATHSMAKPTNKSIHKGTFGEEEKIDYLEIARALTQKNLELAEYEEKGKRIVETMRVHDLTECPRRYRTVRALAAHLRNEKQTKENVRDNLINQRDQLTLIMSHFRYTGAKQQDELKVRLGTFDEAIAAFDRVISRYKTDQQQKGNSTVDIRLTLLALLARFDETGNGPRKARKADIAIQVKLINHKSKKLVKEVENFDQIYQDQEPARDYASYAKPPQVSLRLVRVGGPIIETDSEDDEDLVDSHIPGRLDIKARNQRFKQQAILKRGLK